MAIRTAAEIQARLDQIDAQIIETEKAVQFSLDTGQGRQSVQRSRLDELYRSRDYWERKLDALSGGGLTAVEYRRHG